MSGCTGYPATAAGKRRYSASTYIRSRERCVNGSVSSPSQHRDRRGHREKSACHSVCSAQSVVNRKVKHDGILCDRSELCVCTSRVISCLRGGLSTSNQNLL